MLRLVSEACNVPITQPCLGYLSSGNIGLPPDIVYSVMPTKGNIVPHVPDGLPGGDLVVTWSKWSGCSSYEVVPVTPCQWSG